MKRETVSKILRQNSPALIALSGGMDSSTLLALAKSEDISVAAATIISEFSIPSETKRAEKFCKELNVPWYPMHLSVLSDENILRNSQDRCYHCKKIMMTALKNFAEENNFVSVCDGTHADDLFSERPGLFALNELSIKSPFAEAGVLREEVLAMGNSLGVSYLPPSSCLATRVPFGEKIFKEDLKKIFEAENFLRESGITGVLRVRVSLDDAVIEVLPHEISKAKILSTSLMNFGFKHISVSEYKTGGGDVWAMKKQ